MQERLPRDRLYPWRVLVACALLNRTGRGQVRPMFEALFDRWPTPQEMAAAGGGLELALRPLGLWRRRGATLRRLSEGFARGLPPSKIAGVGRYGLDAYEIFVLGRDVPRPQDHFLKRYVTWRKRWKRERCRSSTPSRRPS